MSAALVQDGEIVWERGFGFQNLESRIRATPDTPYPVGGHQRNGRRGPRPAMRRTAPAGHRRDDPPARWIAVPSRTRPSARSSIHTSAGTPGETFRFDAERYAQLTPVVERCMPQPYRKSVAVNVLERLAMKDSVPGRDLVDPTVLTETLFADRSARALSARARAHGDSVQGRQARQARRETNFARRHQRRDGSRHDGTRLRALRRRARQHLLLREETPPAPGRTVTTSQQQPLPTGLGWFVQTYRDEPVVWHFGLIAERLLVADREAAVPPSDAHPAREQRRLERAFPARCRRRHAIAVRHTVPPPLLLDAVADTQPGICAILGS